MPLTGSGSAWLARVFGRAMRPGRAPSRRALWDSVVESSPDLHAVKDKQGRYLMTNQAFRDLAGITSAQAETIRDEDLPAGLSELAAQSRRVVETGEILVLDISLRRQGSGEARTYRATFHPFREHGRIAGICVSGRDITDRARAEEGLRQAHGAAEEASRAKSSLVASASHDLRQLVQNAVLLADALSRQVSAPAAAALVASLTSSLEVLRTLMYGLLDISQLERGIEPILEEVPVARILQAVEAGCRPFAQAKGLELVVVPSDAWVRTDRILLHRMLQNLIENAIRYTAHGNVVLDCAPESATRLLIHVRDTGPGIPESERERIWEEFRQLRQPGQGASPGLGLGLAIVRRLSEILDHPVTLSSEPGDGATFTVSVPRAAPSRRASAASAAEPGPIPPGLRVLVAEDEILLSGTLRTLLEGWGAEVQVAGDAEAALALVSESGFIPQLVLADYLLPGAKGTDMVRSIRARTGMRIPALLLTGETGDEASLAAEGLGMRVLRKPTAAAEIRAAMAELLSGAAGNA